MIWSTFHCEIIIQFNLINISVTKAMNKSQKLHFFFNLAYLFTGIIQQNVVVIYSLSCVQQFCDPMDYSLPGSSVFGISRARILMWVAISLSEVSSQPRDQTWVSCIGRQILYCWATWKPQFIILATYKNLDVSIGINHIKMGAISLPEDKKK